MLPLESTFSPDSAHTFQQSPTSLKGSSVQEWFKSIFVGPWINKPCWVGLLDLSMHCFSVLLLFRTLMYLWFVFVSWGRCSLKCLSEAGSIKKEDDEARTGLLMACNCRWMHRVLLCFPFARLSTSKSSWLFRIWHRPSTLSDVGILWVPTVVTGSLAFFG